MEPKISGDSASRVCHNLGFEGCFSKEVVGQSGGVRVLCKPNLSKVDIIHSFSCYVHLKVSHLDGISWFLTMVYWNPNGRAVFFGMKSEI